MKTRRRPARSGRPRSTIPRELPPPRTRQPAPRRLRRPPAPQGVAPAALPPRPQVARIVDQSDQSLADVIDSLLNKGVVLNADLILALANVDLVYIRLSALLCAADRIGARESR